MSQQYTTLEENPLDRLPPQSLEAEQAVIGGILIDSGILDRIVFQLKSEDFYRGSHQAIYQAVTALYNQNEPVDLVSVSEMLSEMDLLDFAGGRSYVNDLAVTIATTENVPYYARIVKEKAVLRQLRHAGLEIMLSVYDEPDSEKAVDMAQQRLFELTNPNKEKTFQVTTLLGDAFERIEERVNNRGSLMGISSGFVDLDNLTSGLQKSDLIILAARPSMGKTALVLNILTNVAIRGNTPALIFSLEMSKEQLVNRMIASEGEVDSQRMRMGNLEATHLDKVVQAMESLNQGTIFINDSPAATVMEIRSAARRIMRESNNTLDLIVIDYLQLMDNSTGNKQENRVQELSVISRGLKSIARELNVPVIALSQLSRAVEQRQDKRPMLSDLRDSGAIEQDADLVMFIYREEYYNKESDRPGQADVIIAKQRNGPTGDATLLFQSNITKFKSLYNPGF